MDPLTPRPERSGQAVRFPPHARGWTLGRHPHLEEGDPDGFPRTRGDGPRTDDRLVDAVGSPFPPHARGWTVVAGELKPGTARRRFPRTRGDGPPTASGSHEATSFPPHARGWTGRQHAEDPTLSVSPARAGMDPSAPLPAARDATPVSPARAGMDPHRLRHQATRTGFPRTRGDGPWKEAAFTMTDKFPPHARGWTVRRTAERARWGVSPARAGMDRKLRRD